MLRKPPDILITTPESLYLMITSRAREILTGVEAVIVDEIHAVAQTKRGAHLALTLERLAHLRRPSEGGEPSPQRIGLSATQRPLERIAEFLVGPRATCEIVDAGVRKELDLEIVVPVEDMTEPGADAPPRPRRRAPELAGPRRPGPIEPRDPHEPALDLAGDLPGAAEAGPRAHLDDHLRQQPPRRRAPGQAPERARTTSEPEQRAAGDRARGQRASRPRAERRRRLRRDRPRPPRLARPRGAARRRGAAQVGQAALPRRDLLAGARDRHGRGRPGDPGRVAEVGHARAAAGRPRRPRARRGLEGPDLPQVPRRPARVRGGRQADARRRDRGDGDPAQPARRARPAPRLDGRRRRVGGRRDRARRHRRPSRSRELSREQLENVLDMLDGRYPSERFAELRPRIVWDRTAGTVRGRKGARQLAVTNAGTIPDRGLYGVHLPDGRRVGELDEEMVYEARPGQTFLLGATTWRIEDITRDRVIVTPAPGRPRRGAVLARRRGRPPGRARPGDRRLRPRGGRARTPETLAADYDLDRRAAENLVAYLREQQAATRVVPSDETIVVERFRDEIGDWRLCVLSPFGGRVHAAWGLALSARIRDELDLEADAIWSDDGIVVHLPDADEAPPPTWSCSSPTRSRTWSSRELAGSALFGARFRENAARSLLIPRAYPGKRTPLWQQRLQVAEPARGGEGLPPLPGHPRDLPRVPARRARPAGARRAAARPALAPDLAGRGRDADRLAVRLLAALRLRRHLHVRGRHAERRAPRRGAGARPRPAARAARRRRSCAS